MSEARVELLRLVATRRDQHPPKSAPWRRAHHLYRDLCDGWWYLDAGNPNRARICFHEATHAALYEDQAFAARVGAAGAIS